jgi:hypothetical protein
MPSLSVVLSHDAQTVLLRLVVQSPRTFRVNVQNTALTASSRGPSSRIFHRLATTPPCCIVQHQPRGKPGDGTGGAQVPLAAPGATRFHGSGAWSRRRRVLIIPLTPSAPDEMSAACGVTTPPPVRAFEGELWMLSTSSSTGTWLNLACRSDPPLVDHNSDSHIAHLAAVMDTRHGELPLCDHL